MPDEHEDDLVRVGTGNVGLGLVEPLHHVLETPSASDVVDYDDAHRVAVVAAGDGPGVCDVSFACDQRVYIRALT